MAGNREYKSDVFSMLLEEPKNALSLYNALNGSNYTDSSMVEICALDKGISLSVRNDAAFVVDLNLSIYEHQSTVCPNMPLRNLIYVTLTLENNIKGRDIYGRQLVKIPTPRFAVFYNGFEEQPEQYILKLSDAFEHQTDNPELELICIVYNINHGKNSELLGKCPFLKDYMTFVDYVRDKHKENAYKDLEYCIEWAIDRCIEENVLRDFLIRRRTEVMKVMTLDYTFDTRLMMAKRDSRAEGLEEGIEKGSLARLITLICKKLKKNKSIEDIADDLEEEIEEIAPICMIAEQFAPEYDSQQVLERFLEVQVQASK